MTVLQHEAPTNWRTMKVGAEFKTFNGGTPSKSTKSYWGGSIPWVSSGDVKSDTVSAGTLSITKAGLDNSSAKLCRPGSIIVVVRSGVLKHTLPVAKVTAPIAINQDIKCLDSGNDLLNDWLRLYLKAHQAEILAANREGTTVQSVKTETLEGLEVPTPDDDTIRQVMATLAQLGPIVEQSTAHLERIPTLLRRFRQSVLAAACSGRLTQDWRTDSTSDSATDLLRQIAQSRRDKSKRPPKIESAESGNRNWALTTIGDFCQCLDSERVPVNKEEREKRRGGVPYYGANGQVGTIDTHLFDEELVLVVEDETFIGRTKPFSYVISGKAWVNNHVHVLKPLGGMSAQYINAILSYYDFIPLTSGTTGRRKLTQAALMSAPIEIAPLVEQTEIARRVNSLMAIADEVEARCNRAKELVDKLPQAILAKAFRGELAAENV